MDGKISLTKENFKQLYAAFDHYYPEGSVYPPDKPFSLGDFSWGTRKKFIDFISRLTKVPINDEKDFVHIKQAQVELSLMEKRSYLEEKTTKSTEAISGTTPNKFLREEQEAARVKREEELKATSKKSVAAVRDAIKKQQEIYKEEIQKTKALEEKLKGQKVNYEVQKNKVEESQEVKNLREQANANPQKFINDTAEQFEKNPNLKGLAPQEAKNTAKQAAVTLHDILTDNPDSPVFQATIANKIASDPKLLNKFAPNPQDQNTFKDIASVLADRRLAQLDLLGRMVDVSKIGQAESVVFLDTPSLNSKEFNLSDVASQHVDSLDGQNQLLSDLTSFGEAEIKSRFLLSVGARLDRYVAVLPINSSLARIYNSEIVQLGLSSIGIVEAPAVIAVEGSWIGNLIVSSGFGNVARIIQAKTGISLGVKVAAKVGAEALVKTGTATVAKTGVKALFSKITAAIGSVINPIIGTIVGWIAGELLIKLAGKIPWKKIAPWLLGGGIFLVAGPVAGVTVGLGTFALISGVRFGALGIFLRALGGNVYERILKRFIITFILFCVTVAVVLFIINSGAYVVPPNPFSLEGNPYIDVTKTVEPDTKHENTELSPGIKVTYHVKITAKKTDLSIIHINHKCEIINKGGTSNCPAPLPSTIPTTVSPNSPYTFDYPQTFSGNRYADSLIVNTFEVTADSTEAKSQSASGTASVLVGNPPTGCFELDNSWKDSNKKAAINKAIVRLTQATTYSVRLCQRGAITLKYLGPSNWGGWTIDANTIGIYDYGVALGDTATLYTLAHESGHVFATRTGQYSDDYINKPDLAAERPICSYPVSAHPASEDFAEMIGLYVAKDADTANGIACGMFGNGFREKYPAHWNYANKSIFGGQMLGW